MPKFRLNKLCRAKSAANMRASGAKLESRKLNLSEFKAALKLKLQEETTEVVETEYQKDLIEECCDVIEVLTAIIKVYNLDWQEVFKQRQKKLADRGEFTPDEFILSIELDEDVPEQHQYIRYFRQNSKKYPELEVESSENA